MRAGPLTAPLPYRRPGTGSWPRRTRVPATCPRWSSRPIRAYTQMEQATPIGRPVPMMPVTRRATPSDRTMRRPPPGLTCNSLGVTVGRDFNRGNGGASAVVSSRGWEVILGSERVSRRFPSGFSVGYEEDGSRSLWQEIFGNFLLLLWWRKGGLEVNGSERKFQADGKIGEDLGLKRIRCQLTG